MTYSVQKKTVSRTQNSVPDTFFSSRIAMERGGIVLCAKNIDPEEVFES